MSSVGTGADDGAGGEAVGAVRAGGAGDTADAVGAGGDAGDKADATGALGAGDAPGATGSAARGEQGTAMPPGAAGLAPAPARGIFSKDLLDACISCGFCLPACPTYALTGQEQSSPRGRITLMRLLETGDLAPDDATLAEESSLCLGCRACETVCPAGVQYGHLLEEWRDEQWSGRKRPWIVRPLLLVANRKWVLRLLGLVRRSARKRPGGSVVPGASTGAATSPEPAADHPTLMLGCFERALFPSVSRNLAALDPTLAVDPDQGCCGALHAHNGALDQGRDLARKLGERLPGTIVTTSGGCAAHLADVIGRDRVVEASEWLVKQNPEARSAAKPAAGQPVASQPVAEPAASQPTAKPAAGQPAANHRPLRVALQDSCHLRNGLGVWQQPRDLLSRTATYIELPSAASCCGAAGTYALVRKKESKAILAKKIAEIEAADLDLVIAVNPGCLRQLQTGLRKAKSRTKAVHIVDYLRRAPAPASAPAPPPVLNPPSAPPPRTASP